MGIPITLVRQSGNIKINRLVRIKSFQIFKDRKPICFIEDKIVFSKRWTLLVADTKVHKVKAKFNLPIPLWKKPLFYFKIIRRLLRLDVTIGIYAFNILFVCFNGKMYAIDITQCSLLNEYKIYKGRSPLYLTYIENMEACGFTTGLYFGEYFGNSEKIPVSIWMIDVFGNYKEVYTFAKGIINHIHNIIPDIHNNCVWIFAGDFEESASIWKVEDNFKKVNCVLCGSQQYRACIGFPTAQGLIYATDSQFEENYIRLLFEVNGSYISNPVQKVNGSVIYGCQIKDKFVFSTSTEPSIIRKNKVLHWLERRPGSGIIFNESQILIGNLQEGFNVIHKKNKDFLPYRLFQFGTIKFPAGKNLTNSLYSYSIANISNDMDTEIREFDF